MPTVVAGVRQLASAADRFTECLPDAFRWEFVLQNTSEREMLLRQVRPGCGCSRLERVGETRLQPGEEARYSVVVDLRQLRAYDPSEVRSVELGMTGEAGPAEGPYVPFRCAARGRVHRLLSCTPLEVGLGEDLTCGHAGRQLEFIVRTNRPFAETRLKRVPNGWWAKMYPEAKGQAVYVLRATPIKEEPGLFRDEIELEVVDENGRVFPTQPIKVAGCVTDVIQVLPRCPDLGEMRLGTRSRTTLWVSRKDGYPIRDIEAVSGDPALKVLGARPEGGTWRIDLECTSDAAGVCIAAGTIQVESRRAPQGRARVQVRWYGTS